MKIAHSGKKIAVPEKIGHNYTPVRVIPTNYLHGKKVKNHKRLSVFRENGLKCSADGCSNEGAFLIEGKDHNGGLHIDLYTVDFVLMTIDHVIPRSKGGSNRMENKVPMCSKCNTNKADLLPGEQRPPKLSRAMKNAAKIAACDSDPRVMAGNTKILLYLNKDKTDPPKTDYRSITMLMFHRQWWWMMQVMKFMSGDELAQSPEASLVVEKIKESLFRGDIDQVWDLTLEYIDIRYTLTKTGKQDEELCEPLHGDTGGA